MRRENWRVLSHYSEQTERSKSALVDQGSSIRCKLVVMSKTER